MAEHDLTDLLHSVESVCATSREPIALLDSNGAIVWANASMRRTYGTETSDAPDAHLAVRVFARDPETFEPITLIGDAEEPDQIECLTRHTHGHTMRVECERRRVGAAHDYVMVTLRDVTPPSKRHSRRSSTPSTATRWAWPPP